MYNRALSLTCTATATEAQNKLYVHVLLTIVYISVFVLMSLTTEEAMCTIDFHVRTSSTPSQRHSRNYDHIPTHYSSYMD